MSNKKSYLYAQETSGEWSIVRRSHTEEGERDETLASGFERRWAVKFVASQRRGEKETDQ